LSLYSRLTSLAASEVRVRRAIILVTATAVLAGAIWWWRSHTAPEEPLPPGAGEPARLERLRALLAAAPSAPLPSPQGELEISGRVLGRSGPVAGATVTATTPDADGALSDLPCDPDDPGEKLVDFRCDAVIRLASLIAERRGDAQPMARATTDAAGYFTLRGLAAGDYALWAEAPEGVGVNGHVAAGSSGDVPLGPGKRIRGRVVDGQGHPVEAAVVTVVFKDPSRFFDTLSAADGSFSLGPLPKGDSTVVAQSWPLLPDRAWADARPSQEWLLLTLRAPRRLRGRVLQDGAPVPGASVKVELDRQKEMTTVTDDAGTFELDQLQAGSGFVAAQRGNFYAEAPVQVAARVDPPGVVLNLELGGRVKCSVSSTTGAPIPRAKLLFLDKRRLGHNRDLLADAGGSCHLEGVPTGEYELSAWVDGYEHEGTVLSIHPGETATARLVLEPSWSLDGMVVDAEGRPVAGAGIRLHRDSDEPRRHTGADGRFSLEVPQTDSIDIDVIHDDYVPAVVAVNLPDPHLVVRLTPGSGVDGVVLDGDGSPVEGAYVEACKGRIDPLAPRPARCESLRDGVSDATGAFRLHAMPEGPITLVASRDEHFPQQRIAKVLERPTKDRVALQFRPSGRIMGAAVDEAGHPLGGVRVTVWSNPAGERTWVALLYTSDETGAFEIPALDVGEYQLNASLTGYQFVKVFARTGDEPLKLVLHPTPRVRGRVVTSSGEPVPVFLVNSTSFEEPSGQFAIEREKYGMRIRIDAGAGLATALRIVPEGTDDYALGDVVVSTGRRIAGRVLDAVTGLGISGAVVQATGEPARVLRQGESSLAERDEVYTRPDGSFELPHVGDFAKALVVWHDGYGREVVRVRGETDVQVRLGRTGRIAGEARWNGQETLHVVARGVDIGDSGSADVDASGHFVIDDLEPGTYSMHVYAHDEEPAFFPIKVDVSPGRETQVALVAQTTGGRLNVRVLGGGPDESPMGYLARAPAKLPVNLEELSEAVYDDYKAVEWRGVLEFQRVPPGKYEVLVLLASAKLRRWRLTMVPVVLGEQDRTIEIAVPADAPAIGGPEPEE